MNETVDDTTDVRGVPAEKSGPVRLLVQWLPIVAFFAGAVYLWRSDLAPEIRLASIPLLAMASAAQLLSFVIRAWLLQDFLGRLDARISLSAATVCVFKPILSKYIPGKIWLLISTAGILDSYGVPFRRASLFVAIFQVVLAITGLALGAIALIAIQLPGVSTEARLTMIFLPLAMLVFVVGSSRFSRWSPYH
jgi:hypothetical protein